MLNQHKTTRDNIEKYNKLNPIVDYLLPGIGIKTDVKIADIGSGPYSIIGDYLDGVNIEMHHADNQDFTQYWEKYKTKPVVKIEKEDMEKLSYQDNYFDIVCCINALDHTTDAYKAVEEMIRICKPGGYVFIDCHLDQADTGHKHKWNVKEDGSVLDKSGIAGFNLTNFGFKIQFIDKGGERRYNKIIAILQK